MSGYEIVSARNTVSVSENSPSAREVAATRDCPAGKRAVGGGGSGQLFFNNSFVNFSHIVESRPDGGGAGWSVIIGKPDGSHLVPGERLDVTVYAVCVDAAA
jgi:hypothetical protein